MERYLPRHVSRKADGFCLMRCCLIYAWQEGEQLVGVVRRLKSDFYSVLHFQ